MEYNRLKRETCATFRADVKASVSDVLHAEHATQTRTHSPARNGRQARGPARRILESPVQHYTGGNRNHGP